MFGVSKEFGWLLGIVGLFGVIGAAIAVVFLGWLGVLVVLGAVVFLAILLVSLQNPKVGVYVVAFLLPFERIGSIEAAGTTIRASQVVLLAALVGWVLALLFRRTRIDVRNLAYVPALLFLGVNVLSLSQTENLVRGITVLVFTVFVMLLTVLLPSVLKTSEDIQRIVQLILFSSLLVSLFGLYQFAGDMVGLPPEVTGLRPQYTKDVFGFPRVQSTALEPLYFANYLLLPISLALTYFLFRRRTRAELPIRSWSAFLLLLLTGLNLVLTLSRGGYLGLAAMAALLFFVWFLDGIKLRRALVLGIVAVVALAGAYGALLLTGKERNIQTFVKQATSFEKGAGVEERYTTYEQAGRLILDHPWLGVGVGNFGPATASSPWVQPRDGWGIVNNEYLEMFAETGVFGLFFFFLLLAALVLTSVRVLSASASRTSQKVAFLRLTLLALLAALFGVLVQYNTFSILYILHIWFVIGLLLATQKVLRAD